jgi:hypothetical protein
LLDDIQIDALTEDDKKFLDEFTQLELLSMNQTSLKSLKNFPDAKDLIRVSSLILYAKIITNYC